ncbi:Glycolate dehydrogenase2C FAD-binding subunit GlcE [gamma proteobacterium IMCC2047]|nr:Glycolate dehydrogenase2C FAD-binding subunit GlcE [gamma proteobacterium IMCC2047]
MKNDFDNSEQMQAQINEAIANKQALVIRGGRSKDFLGRKVGCTHLNTSAHRGVTKYEPGELILTARSGTPLQEIKSLLAEQGQMLAFEPPSFGAKATLGGTIACGLSGPRRPYAGSARDFVLGTKIINGKGEILKFGGEVMKNVAGYDVSRLMTGAYGTLGLLLEISLKIMPSPEQETTLVFDYSAEQAIKYVNQLASQPLPLSAACHFDNKLYLRLSGLTVSVNAACQELGGEILSDAESFWEKFREQQLEQFQTDKSFWRISVPPTTAPLPLSGNTIIDWGGGLRWLASDEAPQTVRNTAQKAGGHATLFKNHDGFGEVFQPLEPAIKQLHINLKRAFDPHDILNPGRMYLDI